MSTSYHRLSCLHFVGMSSEGLYRIAGFHDDVESIRMAFDKGNYSIFVFLVQANGRKEGRKYFYLMMHLTHSGRKVPEVDSNLTFPLTSSLKR